MIKKKMLSKLSMIAMLMAVTGSTIAADFPTRDIRYIVPWPAGGGVDGISRKINSIAEQEIDKSIFVENIGGAVTATGLMQMSKARPDGHTIAALTYDSIITLPRGEMVPGYSLDNMRYIARITKEADAIVVSTNSGISTYEELIAAAKADPGTVRIGVAPEGSGPYLAVQRLQEAAGVEFNVIAYPGSSSAETEALLSGEIVAAISSLGDFNGIIESGDVAGVIELSSEQNPSYPDVPPISEKGIDLETGSFIVLAAPAKTPDDVIASLESIYKTAYDSEEFQSWIIQVGVTPSWLGASEVQGWVDSLQSTTFGVMDELGL